MHRTLPLSQPSQMSARRRFLGVWAADGAAFGIKVVIEDTLNHMSRQLHHWQWPRDLSDSASRPTPCGEWRVRSATGSWRTF